MYIKNGLDNRDLRPEKYNEHKDAWRCIFLDRDGTINKHIGFLKYPEQFSLLPRVAESIRLINSSGYLCIVITNQAVIARGEATVFVLNTIHAKLEMLLEQQGAYIDALYYCPHYPSKDKLEGMPSLMIDCSCRKPKPGLVLRAADDFNIDLSQSWFIGDSWRDVQTGINAGTKTVLLRQSGSKDPSDLPQKVRADYKCRDLAEAVDMIFKLC